MKVLVTGLTGRMTGSDRLLYNYATAIYALLDALRALGHEVTVKNVSLGERPEQDYDCALVGLAPFNSLSSRHLFGALHAVHGMSRRVGFFADDWSVVNMPTGMRSLLREPRKRLFRLDNRTQREAALEEPIEKWTAAMTAILHGGYTSTHATGARWKLLAPLFPWGDPAKLLPGCGLEVVGWDPSSVITYPRPEAIPADTARHRRWVLATLQDHTPWVEKQRLAWPVDWYGNKRRGTPFLHELDIQAMYANNWGVLSPQYLNEAEAGWWRMRYLHARDAGAVLYCGNKVGVKMGATRAGSTPYALTAANLESHDDGGLRSIARHQRELLDEKLWTRDRALQAVDDFVKGVAGVQ